MLRNGLDEAWYRIPESRRSSGGVRLRTVVMVGYGQLRWVSAGLRVRMRVQTGATIITFRSANRG